MMVGPPLGGGGVSLVIWQEHFSCDRLASTCMCWSTCVLEHMCAGVHACWNTYVLKYTCTGLQQTCQCHDCQGTRRAWVPRVRNKMWFPWGSRVRQGRETCQVAPRSHVEGLRRMCQSATWLPHQDYDPCKGYRVSDLWVHSSSDSV